MGIRRGRRALVMVGAAALWLAAGSAAAEWSVDEVHDWLRTAAAGRPEVARLVELGRTHEDRPLLALELRPQHLPPSAFRRCAVICRQHGDEPETTAAGLELLRRLIAPGTLRAQQIAGCVATLVIPLANPDGAARGQRENALGQDLNRDWGVGRTIEVAALQALLAEWRPHLVIDVHQWVPRDECQQPLVEPSGPPAAREFAEAMRRVCAIRGYALATSRHGVREDTLCSRHYGVRTGTPAVLLETRHVPASASAQEAAVNTALLALAGALDRLAEQGGWADPAAMPFCGPEGQWQPPPWYARFRTAARCSDWVLLASLLPGAAEGSSYAHSLARGRLRLEMLDCCGAADAFREALVARPDDADALFMLGVALFLEDRVAASAVWFERALARRPGHLGARLYLARCRELEGGAEEAARLYGPAASYGWLGAYRRYARSRASSLLRRTARHRSAPCSG